MGKVKQPKRWSARRKQSIVLCLLIEKLKKTGI